MILAGIRGWQWGLIWHCDSTMRKREGFKIAKNLFVSYGETRGQKMGKISGYSKY